MDVPSDLMEVVPILLKLRDLDELGDVALLDLARDARIETLREGDSVAADQHLDRHVYLLDGEVDLVAGSRIMQKVAAGTERALTPLFRIRTHGLAARCVRPARLLSLDQRTYERYSAALRPRDSFGITFEEFLPSDDPSGLVEEIRHAFYHKEVDLPSLPDLAVRISQAVQNEDMDFHRIASIVQTDPVIAARIVQVANSAMYAGSARVQTVQFAITRVGLQVVRAVVMSVVLKNLFTPKTPLVRKRMVAYYQNSIRVAAVSQALARALTGFEPEQAFLAGLLHDIGVLPLLVQADRHEKLNRDGELLEHIISELGRTVGAMLLEQWDFERELVAVAREAKSWQRDAATPDYCDIVQVAQLHCVLVGGSRIDAPPIARLPAFRRLGLDQIDPVGVIEDARQEILEMINMLAV
jgi:HD-like signal output (HDOD) protein